MGEGHRGMKEGDAYEKREKKRKIGQREQAGKINVEGGKIKKQ